MIACNVAIILCRGERPMWLASYEVVGILCRGEHPMTWPALYDVASVL